MANVTLGVNAEGSGLLMELEREVDNVTIGIDILYDLEHSEDEPELMISSEYIKRIQ